MRKDVPIFKKEKKEIREILLKELGNKKRDDINIFLDQVSAGQLQEATSNYPDIAKVYRNNAFKAIKPTKGRSYRNNKIIDMTLEVLRHPETTAQVLNPGGFEPQKRMGYMVTAYKTGRYTWNELQKMSTDDLKDACYEGKNLSFIDTQIQFYGQNSVAGSILAIFAVAKTAHATLENNGFILNLDTALGTPGTPIRLGNYELSGRVEIDPTFNLEGEYVGKILGSLVASAADAVKDPVLNLMNINVNTVNILNAAIRIGIPFETVAMLLSTNTVTKVLDDLDVANLDNFTSLTQVIKGGIETLTNGATIDNRLFTENLSEEEMLSDINGKANPNVQVKILNMLLQLSNVATALKGVSGITRFNSMASAVGPLIIDNLMLEEKMRDVSLAIEYPYDDPIGTIPITNEVVLNMHPILKQFSRTLDMARYIFGNDSPVNSNSFRAIMDALPSTVRRKLYRDRKLFSKFSDFYQSYIIMLGGVINMNDSKASIDDFPQAFLNKKYKEKYKDNFLIQSIKVNVDEKTKRPVLRIDTTGLDQAVKDKLSNAWIDLYNSGEEGKKLSLKLFKYNFFKGGIGFSPKTFTNLLPVQLKELVPNYTNTFRKLPTIPNVTTFIDQFVQNYCNEPGFLPKRKVDTENVVAGSSLYMKDYFADYFLSSDGKMLFKKTDTSMKEGYPDGSYYMAIPMLGNNNEYIEMSKFYIMTPMKLKEREDSKDTFEITEYNPQENIQSIENKDVIDVEYEEVTEEITTKDRERLEAVQTDMLNGLFGEPTTTEANRKSVEKGVAKVLKENDIEISQEEVNKEVKKFC